jgi:hypothetical protein
MQGVITARHVLLHPYIICSEYGISVYLMVIRIVITRRRGVTFLQLITRHG